MAWAATATSPRSSRSRASRIVCGEPGHQRGRLPAASHPDDPRSPGVRHVRPTRKVDQAELDALYAAAYDGEPFVHVVDAPPATKHVNGSNHARIHVRFDERTGRILVLSVIDNLVKGAAGQAIQAFNVAFGLPETAGLDQLPLAP